MRGDDLVEPFEDGLEPRRQVALAGLDAAAGDVAKARAVFFDDAESGDAQPRIDAEDDQSITAVE
jgi:hypothetical protein